MYLVVLVASLMIFCGVTAVYLRSGYFSVFHPFTIYNLFHGLVFVIRPLFSYWLEYEAIYNAYQFTPSLSDKITVIVAANVGLLSFAFFCFRQGAVSMRFRSDPLLVPERNRLARFFLWVLVICAPMAIWSLFSAFNAATDYNTIGDMGRDMATGVIYHTRSNGYFDEAQMMLVPLSALSAWLFRFRLIALAPLALFVLMRAGTGGRGPFVAALFAAGLLYLYDQRRRFPTMRVSLALAAAALLFALIGSDRGQSVRAWFGGETDARLVGRSDLRFMEGMDFGNLEFFEYIVYVIPQRSQTYGYFNDVLQVFTEPVPRVLWKDKPFGAPFQRFSMFDYGFPVGYTRSLPGNGWYAMGWLGVIITCGLWGYVLGLIYRRFVEGTQSTYQVAAYMVFLPILIVAYRDGMIVTVFRQGIFFMAPILLWIWIARFFNAPLAADIHKARALRAHNDARLNGPEAVALARQPQPAGTNSRYLPPAVLRRRIMQRGGRET